MAAARVMHGLPGHGRRGTVLVWFLLLLLMAQASARWEGNDQEDASLENHDNEVSVALGGVGSEQDIHSYLIVLDESKDSSDRSSVHEQPVSVMWGIADTTATVGKLFSYTLPKEAFKGEVTEYKVTEASKDSLPSWLVYNATAHTLMGVPGQEELGQQYLIQVTALSHISDDAMSHAKDIFTISVVEDNAHLASLATPLKEASGDGMKPIRCSDGSPVTMVTIIVDVSLESLLTKDKLDMMHGMCNHLSIPTELLKLMPVGNKPMFDSSALVAGPGDVKQPEHTGAVMQWEVGCGNVNANHMPVLQRVESTSHDGSMSKAVRHGIIGWHVTNNRPHAPQRMKRNVQIYPTPTPQPTIGPPTKQPMVPTMVIDETDQPVTRVVPTMASPVFPGEIVPTRTRGKHHHRTKTKGRHQHHRTKHPKHSPTRKPHRKTQATRTPMPTPTVQPILPTRVVDITPTLLETALERPKPTYGYHSPGVSRTDDVLEPSMTPVHPPAQTEATEILPTRTYVVPEIMTTEKVHATKTDTGMLPTKDTMPTTTEQSRRTKKPKKDKDRDRDRGKEQRTKKPRPEPRTTPMMPISPTEPFNYAPILRNDIDRIVVTAGDVLHFKVPKDTFYDFEDGNTENLKLVFMTVDGLTLPPDSWVQFNVTSQILYGLPLPNRDEGRNEYIMAAIDRKGKIARDAFEIVIERRSHEQKINHEFSLTLDTDYDAFIQLVDRRLEVASKLAKLYGDPDSSKMTVTKIARGSVVYAWTNNTVPPSPCPVRQIAELLRYLVNENDTLNQTLVETMKPYRILKAGAEPRGVCVDAGIKNVETSPTTAVDKSGGPVEQTPRETSNEDVLITTVIPAVVIAAMLLLAACIACILYRKKRKGKLTDEDQHTFVNKGIPIIFADELEEKPDPSTKPLILDDEKPPLPPPEYPRSGSGSAPSTPRSDHKEPFDTDEDRDDMTSPLYQPPPPFTGSRENRHPRPRGPQQPAYRNPPPYVPP